MPPADVAACHRASCVCGLNVLVGPAPETQSVAITPQPPGSASGTLTLTVFASASASGGFTTDDISVSASAADVKTALESVVVSPSGGSDTLKDLLGNITVTPRTSGAGWVITFDDQFVDMPLMAVDASSVSGASVVVRTRVHGRPHSTSTPKDSHIDDAGVIATLILNFVAMVTSAIASGIAIVYTSESGRRLYLGELHSVMGVYASSTKKSHRGLASMWKEVTTPRRQKQHQAL